jgi:hypothetical protein
MADRNRVLGKPQIALRDLTGPVDHPVDRINPDILGPDAEPLRRSNKSCLLPFNAKTA